MARPSRSTDNVGGRFALLDNTATADMSWEVPMKDSSPKSSKRRRRKSAKGHNDEEQKSLPRHSVTSNGSSSGSVSYGKPPLRTISELADLRTNSADVSTRYDIAIHQHPGPIRPARQTSDETQPTHKPHLSLSFQDSRPATEGMAFASYWFDLVLPHH